MKRLLLPLIAALALPTAVSAEFDPEAHQLCIDQKNYIGCMTTNSKSSPSISASKSEYINNYLELKHETKRCSEKCYVYSVKNNGDQILKRLTVKATYFDQNGLAFKEEHYGVTGPLKPNFIERKGPHSLDWGNYDDIWSGEMEMEISDIQFQ